LDDYLSPAETRIRNFALTFSRLLPWCFRGNSPSSTAGLPNAETDQTRRRRGRGPRERLLHLGRRASWFWPPHFRVREAELPYPISRRRSNPSLHHRPPWHLDGRDCAAGSEGAA